MPNIKNVSPEILPTLSRGKHRNPRRGACFMEYASYLAGERWSDHPPCTHPALASLARLVNDWTTDAGRSRLAVMIPSVIDLNGRDPRIAPLLAVRATAAALPVASEPRQRALAVGLIRCETLFAELHPDDTIDVAAIARAALDQAPLAERWARRELESVRTGSAQAPLYDAIVSVAVAGIGQACIQDPDDRLRQLLRVAIDDCTTILRPGDVVESRRTLTRA